MRKLEDLEVGDGVVVGHGREDVLDATLHAPLEPEPLGEGLWKGSEES